MQIHATLILLAYAACAIHASRSPSDKIAALQQNLQQLQMKQPGAPGRVPPPVVTRPVEGTAAVKEPEKEEVQGIGKSDMRARMAALGAKLAGETTSQDPVPQSAPAMTPPQAPHGPAIVANPQSIPAPPKLPPNGKIPVVRPKPAVTPLTVTPVLSVEPQTAQPTVKTTTGPLKPSGGPRASAVVRNLDAVRQKKAEERRKAGEEDGLTIEERLQRQKERQAAGDQPQAGFQHKLRPTGQRKPLASDGLSGPPQETLQTFQQVPLTSGLTKGSPLPSHQQGHVPTMFTPSSVKPAPVRPLAPHPNGKVIPSSVPTGPSHDGNSQLASQTTSGRPVLAPHQPTTHQAPPTVHVQGIDRAPHGPGAQQQVSTPHPVLVTPMQHLDPSPVPKPLPSTQPHAPSNHGMLTFPRAYDHPSITEQPKYYFPAVQVEEHPRGAHPFQTPNPFAVGPQPVPKDTSSVLPKPVETPSMPMFNVGPTRRVDAAIAYEQHRRRQAVRVPASLFSQQIKDQNTVRKEDAEQFQKVSEQKPGGNQPKKGFW